MERFNRLAHSVWDRKYHIVRIPKYRRNELYGAKRRIVVDTIKQWSRMNYRIDLALATATHPKDRRQENAYGSQLLQLLDPNS